MDVTLRQLRVFRSLAVTGTTRAAAAQIGLTQSAVNRILCQLEDQLGTQLFSRSKGKLTLTAQGMTLVSIANDVVQNLDEVQSITKEQANSRYRTLRIGCINTLSSVLLPRAIATISQRYGNLRFSVTSAIQRHLESITRNGELDIAVIALPAEHASTEVEIVGTMDRVCILPLGHRLAGCDAIEASDLVDEEFISHTEGSEIRRITDEFFIKNHVRRSMAFEARSTEIRCAMVAQGLGVSLVLLPYAQMWSKRLVIRPFLHDYPFQVGVTKPAEPSMAKAVSDFVSELRMVVKSIGRALPDQEGKNQIPRSARSANQPPSMTTPGLCA